MSAKRSKPSGNGTGAATTVGHQQPVVVVAGDASANWLLVTGANRNPGAAPAKEETGRIAGWRRQSQVVLQVREGGALLLSRLLSAAFEAVAENATVLSPEGGVLATRPPDEIVRSYARLGWFPDVAKGKPVLRIASSDGCSGPRSGDARALPVKLDSRDADVVVLYDAGSGFIFDRYCWPLAAHDHANEALFVLGLSRGLSDNPLLAQLKSNDRKIVVLVDADDLRADGIPISRRLSWERTAMELMWQLQHNSELRALAGIQNLVVRFGLEGAVHAMWHDGSLSARIYYDPACAEGGFGETARGTMIGTTEAFIAAFVARAQRESNGGLSEAIRDGIRSARRLARRGFGTDPLNPDFPCLDLFAAPSPSDDFIADAAIPLSGARDSADPAFWCLLDKLGGRGLEPLAHRILRGDDRGLASVPLGQFGDLRTVDRSEIESFSSIESLIGQYLARRETKRPLCLAVFGPPGSGKSFGVEQVAKSVAMGSGTRVEKIEVNMSQLESTKGLANVLHLVRDEVVKGRVPLVFFDEFDASFGAPLGWLRYFLAPMQDGAFRDGEAVHPIGKAIFVFAGGLSPTFAHFSRTILDSGVSEAQRADELRRFREAKGPDFVSRLRGFVNVKGPNPDPARPNDRFHLIRRAMIARSILERNWPSLRSTVDPRELSIDDSIVRAMIGVPVYKHGVRSLEAVLEMSMLDGRTEFDPSALPAPEQLDQHVDAAAFARLVLQGVLFAAAREAIAEAIHDRYRTEHANEKEPGAVALRPWKELPDGLRSSNRAQADDMIRKLERIDCGYRPAANGKPTDFRLTEAEVEQLAELEHERWMGEKMTGGYSFGPRRDDSDKTHPDLVPWSKLPEKSRAYDRATVAAIPDFMASAGFEVYRL